VIAYPVPFRLHHARGSSTFELVNMSSETVTDVAFTLFGAGVMAANEPATLEPGGGIEVTIAGARLTVDSLLVVCWCRPDGVEYLWRVAATDRLVR
jgi:hypothetical protein